MNCAAFYEMPIESITNTTAMQKSFHGFCVTFQTMAIDNTDTWDVQKGAYFEQVDKSIQTNYTDWLGSTKYCLGVKIQGPYSQSISSRY